MRNLSIEELFRSEASERSPTHPNLAGFLDKADQRFESVSQAGQADRPTPEPATDSIVSN